jgi:hypothetical protein
VLHAGSLATKFFSSAREPKRTGLIFALARRGFFFLSHRVLAATPKFSMIFVFPVRSGQVPALASIFLPKRRRWLYSRSGVDFAAGSHSFSSLSPASMLSGHFLLWFLGSRSPLSPARFSHRGFGRSGPRFLLTRARCRVRVARC